MRLIHIALLLVSIAATGAPVASAQGHGSAAADAEIFEAVVAEVGRSAQGMLVVDPRPIQAGADLTSVEPDEVGPVSAERERVLRKMEIQTTVFLSDQRCLFAHGLPPAPGFGNVNAEQQAARQECRTRAPFTSAIISSPQRDRDTVTVAVAQMTTSSYAAREYVLRRCGPGAWRVIATRELIGPVQS